MKNKFLGIDVLIALIGFFLVGCAGNAQPASAAVTGGKTLDQAIAEAAVRIDERIEAGTKIALLNFNSPSDRFSLYVLDELSANLLDSGRLTVVDRREVDLIRNEFEFQFSGEVGDDSMQELGRMLGAQSIVSGSLTEIGGDYRIVIRVLNVQTASVAVQYRADIDSDRRVQSLLEGGRTSGTATASTRTTASSRPAAQPQAEQIVVQAQSSAPANGTYTFLPRLRGYIGAAPVEAYLSHIVVRGDYMAVYASSSVTGWRPAGSRVFRDGGSPQNVRLRDLDNPGQTYYPEPGMQSTHSWDNNGEWFTFRGVKGRRFSLTISHEAPPLVWDEIILGVPNRD